MKASVRPSGEIRGLDSWRPAVVSRRGASPVDPSPVREPHRPQRRVVRVVGAGDLLDHEDGQVAVRREPRIGGDAKARLVIGARGTAGRRWSRRAGLRKWWPAGAGDEAESSDYHRRAMSDQLSLRLEPALPNPPSNLRPMLARLLPEPFDSPDHLFEPSWGGRRSLAVIGPGARPGEGEVSLIDADGVPTAVHAAGARRPRRPPRRPIGGPRR